MKQQMQVWSREPIFRVICSVRDGALQPDELRRMLYSWVRLWAPISVVKDSRDSCRLYVFPTWLKYSRGCLATTDHDKADEGTLNA